MKLEKRVCMILKEGGKKFQSIDELGRHMKGEVARASIAGAITSLRKQGLVLERNTKFALCENLGYRRAEITKIGGNFGFAKLLDEIDAEGNEVFHEAFIPGRMLQGAMTGDKVVLNIFRQADENNRSDTGEVMAIASEEEKPFSGIVTKERGNFYLVPDSLANYPFFVPKGDLGGAQPGDKVLASLSYRGKSHAAHNARVLNVFGPAVLAKHSCQALLAAAGVKTSFPEPVLAEAASVSKRAITEQELAGRLDLRDENIFTIDSADTKDIDDAISLRKEGENWVLGVHIADVTHYVTPKTALDDEAFARGTSIYYADQVLPMLPKELSNGICSLNEKEDRLAFSCHAVLSPEGDLIRYTFSKSVIRSRIKGVYSEINQLLAGTADESIEEKYAQQKQTLLAMQQLAALITKRRFARGGLDLTSSESKIVLDSEGRAIEILSRVQGESEQMIEEFMLTANESAANFARKAKAPFVYRVHDDPPPDKIENLRQALRALGFSTRELDGKIRPSSLASILERAKDTPMQRMVNSQILRSMAKAAYSESPIGHFGLVLKDYAHFTSPIRRYPDLCIHRILGDLIAGVPEGELDKRYKGFVKKASEQSTQREILAMQIERGCEDYYKAEYISRFIGQSFDGFVSGVTGFGVYVELENTVEGLCRIENLPPGDYSYDGFALLTERLSGKKYSIGCAARIKVIGADVGSGKIDFTIEPQENTTASTAD